MIDTCKKILFLFNKSERIEIAFFLIGMLIMALLEVVGVISIVPFMAVASNPELIAKNKYLILLHDTLNFSSDKDFLVLLGCIVLATLAISNLYNIIFTWKVTFFGNMYGHRLSKRLLRQYLSQPYIFFLNRNTADMGKNILTEASRVVNGVILNAIKVLSKCAVVISMLVMLMLVDTVLAITVTVVLGGTYWMIFLSVRKHLHKIGTASTQAVLDRYKIANEALVGVKELKLRGTELEFVRRFSIPSKAYAEYAAQSTLISALPRYAMEIIAFGGIIAITIYLTLNSSTPSSVIPLVSLYALAGFRMMPALQQVYLSATTIKYTLPVLNILFEDFSLSKNLIPLQEVNLRKPLTLSKKIELQSLCFTYPNVATRTLDNINLKIDADTTVGIVGSTGSGKTTLIDVLLGLLPINSGKLLVDGIEITHKNMADWQHSMGYISQDIYLTDDTIERNIAFAIPNDEIDINKVRQAGKMAELDSFVETLPEKYQTFVGERGVRLSGGQRQRIGIARALYHNPNVLIMDEATSALDGITEKVIMEAIENLSHNKTIIMIAHRLTTVKECDVIHVMNQGRIIDSGTYDELILRNTHFRKMANIQ